MDPTRFDAFRFVGLARTIRRFAAADRAPPDPLPEATAGHAPLAGRAGPAQIGDGRIPARRGTVPHGPAASLAARAAPGAAMNVFECDSCGQLVHFGNTSCTHCGARLAFDPSRLAVFALAPDGAGGWRIPEARGPVKLCENAIHGVCNWVLPADEPWTLCRACRLNRTIPDLSVPDNRVLWGRLEEAKHRLVYGLLRLGLPLAPKSQDPDHGLAFDFLADPHPAFREGPGIVTGHSEGVVTINVREADPVERERARQSMAEPYRTLIGHFRHESGHYYWERLVKDQAPLERFRTLFGDERADYAAALERHYARTDKTSWPEHHVSFYASAHPWEDFAETWAHYLHIVDTLDTAWAYGLRVRPRAGQGPGIASDIRFPAYEEESFDRLIDAWLPLTYAVNSLNESMGQPRLYPFVLAAPVLEKLSFVHRLVRRHPAQ